MPHKKSAARVRAVLDALEEGATFAEAARLGGISYSTLRAWRLSDPKFAEDCAVAIDAGTDLIEAEARRRAVTGIEKPVGFHQGKHLGVFARDYSDSLLVLLLKARRPEMYRDGNKTGESRDVDVTGARDALQKKLARRTDR